ncbi:MAG: Asp-tRNA(Asn)/Glu-tRNA(Gln) amidotransferase subunit GatA [Oscillospiraceae bacterium]|nr:Asp-tRNA(Asn)/Glu-tRNA(Gln) amidotransferase subunit GatA [Oscillospiraceae bacterium]
MNFDTMTVSQIARMVSEKKISSGEVSKMYFERIRKEDKNFRSYITVCEEEKGETSGRLAGVPISIKDNICMKGTLTTCASRMLEGYVSPYNAHVVDRLSSEGALITGKTNLDEFAMGSFGDNSALFQTKNPVNVSYLPGGSSSGAAASVAGGMCVAAIGSDTGGSVRIPAAFCGLCGFKPTYGAISRFGLIAYASSLDTIGIVTRNATDAKLLSSVLFGKDERDMTSYDVNIGECEIALGDIRFAFSDKDLEDAETEIAEVICRVRDLLLRAGASCVDKTLFGNAKSDNAYRVLACAEATSNLARYDGIRYGGKSGLDVLRTREELFGEEVKRRIEYGNFVLAKENFEKYFKAAADERTRVIKETEMLFEDVDVIISPLCDFSVPTYSNASSCRADRFTVAANFAGNPAISITAGRDKNNMPVSVQLMSARGCDAKLLSIAEKLEQLLLKEGAV